MGKFRRSLFRFTVFCLAFSTLPAQDIRPFHLGFTPFPPDLTNQAVTDVYQFISEHGDLLAHHFDSGVPWTEAYQEREYSTHLRNDWNFRKSKIRADQAVYVSITPLNFNRDNLAPYWGNSDNMQLPDPWGSYDLNHQAVKRAFLTHARRAIEHFNPDYLAIGIESNILISKAPGKWTRYLELNQYVYSHLKQEYPRLKVFSTVQYEHLRGIEDESKGNLSLQESGVRELMKHSDLLALSTYHFGFDHNPIGEDYFEFALSFGKPLAISETGAFSKIIEISGIEFEASEQDQRDFLI